MRCSDARRARRRARSTAATRGGSAQCTRVARFRVCGAGASCIGAPFAERARRAHVGQWVCKFVSARRASPARRSKRTATEDGGAARATTGARPRAGRMPRPRLTMAVGRTTIESRIANRTSRIAPESTHDRIARDRNIPPAGADALPDASAAHREKPCRRRMRGCVIRRAVSTPPQRTRTRGARPTRAKQRPKTARAGAGPAKPPRRAARLEPRQPCPVRLSRAPASAR
ncbi:Uncharacterised protein [Burkholderia pseudomallei]|nr:Uncharacterised protein [Burkholderia pseudomallei]